MPKNLKDFDDVVDHWKQKLPTVQRMMGPLPKTARNLPDSTKTFEGFDEFISIAKKKEVCEGFSVRLKGLKGFFSPLNINPSAVHSDHTKASHLS